MKEAVHKITLHTFDDRIVLCEHGSTVALVINRSKLDEESDDPLSIYEQGTSAALRAQPAKVLDRIECSAILGIWSLKSGPHLAVVTDKEFIGLGPRSPAAVDPPRERSAGESRRVKDGPDLSQARDALIYRITGCTFVPVQSKTPSGYSRNDRAEDAEYLKMLRSISDSGSLYYGENYDITHSLQRSFTLTKSERRATVWERADARFFWNLRATKVLRNRGLGNWVCPIIRGYADIRTHCEANGKFFSFLLISRRAANGMSGTRFNKRGLDVEGNAGNFVETEQVMIYADGSSTSFVQVRGSIPVMWTQRPTLMYTPRCALTESTSSSIVRKAVDLHFNDLAERYSYNAISARELNEISGYGEEEGSFDGNAPSRKDSTAGGRTVCVNLVDQLKPKAVTKEIEKLKKAQLKKKKKDKLKGAELEAAAELNALRKASTKRRDQHVLGVAMQAVIDHRNELIEFRARERRSSIAGNKLTQRQRRSQARAAGEAREAVFSSTVRNIWFDFHRECHGMRYDKLALLLDKLALEYAEHEDGAEEDAIKSEGEDTFVESKGDGITASSSSTSSSSKTVPLAFFSADPQGVIRSLQRGIIRTNCMDCLDRTNVVQSVFARASVLQQLGVVASNADGSVKNCLDSGFSEFEPAFKNSWADNADSMSEVYSGSPALKTDFTRTGIRTHLGMMQDGRSSVTRFYKNNFTDGWRQDATSIFLCRYKIPKVGTAKPGPGELQVPSPLKPRPHAETKFSAALKFLVLVLAFAAFAAMVTAALEVEGMLGHSDLVAETTLADLPGGAILIATRDTITGVLNRIPFAPYIHSVIESTYEMMLSPAGKAAIDHLLMLPAGAVLRCLTLGLVSAIFVVDVLAFGIVKFGAFPGLGERFVGMPRLPINAPTAAAVAAAAAAGGEAGDGQMSPP